MKNDLFIKNGITIPEHELEISTSRSGGAGGQHVNKTETRITVRWNATTTTALSDEQKNYLLEKLQSQLTSNGDIVVHNSESRSQQQNKKNALNNLTAIIRNALHKPKKRVATKISKALKEARLKSKAHRGKIKEMRSKKIDY
ncbi:MAG TPA: alternative ribosome rescue aminoacyl-tRNA hydrolase ArfB [Candidatus Babeliales bacterium]|jgi:ribosome-associated protein|nr:alternative ribosome rescue aminoacyl-tRNA hydrolase ArfB [Candidatus Babeliales bacterium]